MKITRLLRHDFKRKNPSNTTKWYDLYGDWHLIESSFTKQYGIRLRNEPDMTWDEFSTLLAGIMPETPLGQIISIRSEDDPDILKSFNSEQKKIRNEWRSRLAQDLLQGKGSPELMIAHFQQMMKQAFSKHQD